MGASVQPVSIDDDLKAIRAKAAPRSIDDDLAKIRGQSGDVTFPPKSPRDTMDLTAPRAAADDTSVAPRPAADNGPGFLGRLKQVNAGVRKALVPAALEQVESATKKFGEDQGKFLVSQNPGRMPRAQDFPTAEAYTAAQDAFAKKYVGGFTNLATIAGGMEGRAPEKVAHLLSDGPPPVSTEGQSSAPRLIAPKAPVEAPAPQLRIERRSSPSENRPVWTQAERDAFHADQTAQYDAGLKNWEPGQPVPRLIKPTHPDVSAANFARGRTEPFPYQTAAELAEQETAKIARRKPQTNAVNPKYRLDPDADLLSRAGELSARMEEYSSGEHGAATFARDAVDLSKPITGTTRVATRMNQDRDLYHGVVAELKARGWQDSDISDAVDERAGMQYRHSGVGLNPETAKSVKDVVNSALYSPAAAIRESHPELTAAGEAAISAPANARHIGQVQTKWVTEGIRPEAAEAFLPQLQLDRLNHMLTRDPSLAHDPAFVSNLNDLQKRVPQGFHETPEFKQMVDRYKTTILSQTESAAASAGLKPEQFADLPNGYARLVPSENAPEGTFADYVGGTGPKKGPATRLTTAQKATGTGAYTNSLSETVTQDALDKIVKARHNEFYQQLLKEGTVLEDPRAAVPEGQAKVSFDDKGNVISDPSQAKITLQVPKDVAQYAAHVYKTLNETGPTTPAGVAAKSASHAAGGLALLANPAAATSHSLTLANTVGTVPEVGKPLNNLVGVVPGGTTAKGAFDIATVDRTTPETRALEQWLSRIGALRPEMNHPTEGMGKVLKDLRAKLGPLGKVLSPHEILFGEDGIDKRSRIALAEKYIQAAKARDIPVTDAGLREFVVSKAGDYIKGNAGALVNHLQDSNMALFARMGVTRVTNAAKSAVGKSGLPEATRLQKAGDIASTLTRGIAGYGVGLTALNYYLSGHSPLSNEPGHMGDLEYKTDEKGKKHYVRGAILNPLVSTAMRAGGESIIRGDPAGVLKDATNTALGVATSHPLVRGAVEATTGRTPYIERDGSMMKTVPSELSSGDQVTGRLKAAGRDMTAAGQFLGAGSEKNPGLPGGKVLSYLLPPITATASPGGESRLKAQSAKDWLDDRVSQTYRAAGDTEKQKQIIEQALQDAKKFNDANKDDQVTLGLVNKELRKAAAKANANFHRPNRLVRPQ